MGMLRVSWMIWVFRILNILLTYLRLRLFVGHTVRQWIADSVVCIVVGLEMRRFFVVLEVWLGSEQVIDLLRNDVNEVCDATTLGRSSAPVKDIFALTPDRIGMLIVKG